MVSSQMPESIPLLKIPNKEIYSNGLFWESPSPGGSIPESSQPQTDCNGDGQWQGANLSLMQCNLTLNSWRKT
jgi:hypothetical protein